MGQAKHDLAAAGMGPTAHMTELAALGRVEPMTKLTTAGRRRSMTLLRVKSQSVTGQRLRVPLQLGNCSWSTRMVPSVPLQPLTRLSPSKPSLAEAAGSQDRRRSAQARKSLAKTSHVAAKAIQTGSLPEQVQHFRDS